MKFDAIKKAQPITEPTLESSNTSYTIDVEGQSMNIAIITDEMIEENGLQEVSDPVWFKNGNEPTDYGLFSPIIFGDTPKQRMRTHAYINLKRNFFHPYVFEILTKIYSNFDTIASGEGAWYINEDGTIEQITDQNDVRYNEDNTGLAWLIDNFKKIKFKVTGSSIRDSRLKLLENLSDNEIFISKWIVIPVFYRDYDSSSGMASVPEINNYYRDIIINTKSYENEILAITKHLTLYKTQNALVEIRKFGQKLIEKKHGAFQKTILGKATDFGSRGVISVPSLNGCETPNDCIVDITHSGIPLSKCLEMGYPFLIKWVTDFFEDMFRNKQHVPIYRRHPDKEPTLEYVEIGDQSEMFTESYIKKKFKMYEKTFGAERFETIKIKCKDGTEAELLFTGKGYASNPSDPRANTISNRPLTWTDVIYMAAEETLSNKYCYITRYPLEDYFGTFPSQVAVLSTIKTSPVIINGKVYPHYPVIDLSLPEKEIATQFIDTISVSNLYLDAIGGD